MWIRGYALCDLFSSFPKVNSLDIDGTFLSLWWGVEFLFSLWGFLGFGVWLFFFEFWVSLFTSFRLRSTLDVLELTVHVCFRLRACLESAPAA